MHVFRQQEETKAAWGNLYNMRTATKLHTHRAGGIQTNNLEVWGYAPNHHAARDETPPTKSH